VLLGIILAAVAAVVPQNSWDRLTTIGAELNGGGMNDRLSIWRIGLKVFSASVPNAMVGVGADGFLAAIGLGYVAHNTYLSILVNNGIVGFVIFLSLLARAAMSALRSASAERKAIVFSLLCWMVAIAAGSWDHNRVAWFLLAISYTAGAPVLPAISC
jgi:O-antigen ligase